MRRAQSNFPAKLASALVIFLAIGSLAEEISIEYGPSIIMTPIDEYVIEEGEYHYDIEFILETPCSALAQAANDLKQRPIISAAYRDLKNECEKLVSEQWTPQLELLMRCIPEDKKKDKYGKRVVWFLVAIVALVVTSGTYSVVDYFDDETEEIKKLQKRDDYREIEVKEMKKQLKEQNQNFNNKTVTVLETFNSQLDGTRKNVTEIGEGLPQISIAGAKFIYKINRFTENLKDVNSMCGKRRVATTQMSELIEDDILRGIEPEDTRWKSITRKGEIFNFQFSAIKRARDCTVYRVKGLALHGNHTQPKYLYRKIYAGPPFAMFNSTSNCTKGVEIENGHVFDTCTTFNYFDERIYETRNQTLGITEQAFNPQVIRGQAYNYVYCGYGNITINNKMYPCAAVPLKIPKTVSFITGNLSYTAEEVQLRAKSSKERVFNGNKGKIIMNDPNTDAILVLRASVAQMHNSTVQLDLLGEMKEALMNLDYKGLAWSYMPAIGMILTVLTLMIQLCGGRRRENINNVIEMKENKATA